MLSSKPFHDLSHKMHLVQDNDKHKSKSAVDITQYEGSAQGIDFARTLTQHDQTPMQILNVDSQYQWLIINDLGIAGKLSNKQGITGTGDHTNTGIKGKAENIAHDC